MYGGCTPQDLFVVAIGGFLWYSGRRSNHYRNCDGKCLDGCGVAVTLCWSFVLWLLG